MLSHGVGTLRTRNHLPGGRVAEIVFKNVLFVPEFGINILSVKHVASKKQGCAVMFMGDAQFYDREENLIGWSPEPEYHTDLYPLICEVISRTTTDNRTLITTRGPPVTEERRVELLALHSRLAHVGAGAIGRLQPGLKRNEQLVIQTCPACIQAKMVQRPYLDIPPELRATKPGKVISADVLNPSATSAGGA